jgi:hypothetical protein
MLPKGNVTKASAKHIYRLYKKSKRDEPPYHLDYLLKYWEVDQKVFIRITKVILRKSKKDRSFGLCLSLLFNPYSDVNKRIVEIYRNHLDLLKKAFFCALEVDPHADYDGTTINKILDVDSSFMVEYIHWMYGKKEWLSKYDDSRDYSFLWQRGDYNEAMAKILDCVLAIELQKGMRLSSYLETFFGLRENVKNKELIIENQDKFIRKLIEKQSQESALMKLLFLVIASFEPERRASFIAIFVAHNKRFEDLKELPLEPTSGSWIGSEVPLLKTSIKYFESLLPLFTNPDLIEHKQLIENHILSLGKRMEWEKKRDFMDD